jgi:hypothetical protein
MRREPRSKTCFGAERGRKKGKYQVGHGAMRDAMTREEREYNGA